MTLTRKTLPVLPVLFCFPSYLHDMKYKESSMIHTARHTHHQKADTSVQNHFSSKHGYLPKNKESEKVVKPGLFGFKHIL